MAAKSEAKRAELRKLISDDTASDEQNVDETDCKNDPDNA